MNISPTHPSHLSSLPLLTTEVITEAAPAEYLSCACKSCGEAVRRCQEEMEGHPKLVSGLCEAEEVSKLSTWTRNELSSTARAAAKLSGTIGGDSLLFIKVFDLKRSPKSLASR